MLAFPRPKENGKICAALPQIRSVSMWQLLPRFALLNTQSTLTHTLSNAERQPYWGINFKRDLCAQQKGYKIFIVSCCMANDKQTITTKKKPKSQAGKEGEDEVEIEATAECVCKSARIRCCNAIPSLRKDTHRDRERGVRGS